MFHDSYIHCLAVLCNCATQYLLSNTAPAVACFVHNNIGGSSFKNHWKRDLLVPATKIFRT